MGAAAVPVALFAIGTGIGAYSAMGQVDAANDSRDLQLEQIRIQQVQTRIQENQASIERMKKLRMILATEQVMTGARNISPMSGTVRAITQQNFTNYLEDEQASRLNFLGKQVGFDIATQGVNDERNARAQSAWLGFFQNTVGLGMALHGMPSQSLVDRSAPAANQGQQNPFNVNRTA